MPTQFWHAYYYESLNHERSPILSAWIEAASEDEAIEIARKHDGRWRSCELIRPRWEAAAPPVHIQLPDAPEILQRSAH